MARKPRVHEVTSELGVDVKVAMATLKSMGVFVKGPSSSIEPPVARRLREALIAGGHTLPPFPSLTGAGAGIALTYAAALPRRLPELIDLLIRDHQPGTVAEVVALAAADRWFFYVPGRAHDTINRQAASLSSFADTHLPTPSGVALIVQPESTATPPALLLAWAAEPTMLHLGTATLSVSRLGNRLVATRARQQKLTRGANGYATKGDNHLQLLGALWSVVPERLPTAGTAPGRSTATTREVSRVDSTETRIIYATRTMLGATSAHEDGGIPRSGRWDVRGHWRNQWRPSTKDHARIWIAEHTAGAAEGELQQRDRVYVVAPPTVP